MDEKEVELAKVSEDKRWRLVNRTMRLHGYEPDALIETLHTVQESFGFLDMDSLRYVATILRLPLSLVYGVATFYHYFTLKPPGDHTCVVCLGTACYIAGSSNILGAVEQETGLKPGETTADNKLSLLTARCMGSCGLAPVVCLDKNLYGKMSSASVLDKIRRLLDHDD
ncbi:MAG: bidirectional hydrogenase complex protein HoxE [Desulfomonilaceae bacterium]